MPEHTFTQNENDGLSGTNRGDLPAWGKERLIPNGETSTDPVKSLAIHGGDTRDLGPENIRKLTYEYVDTGHHSHSDSNVLWSDSASWCTIATLWSPNRAGLGHFAPDSQSSFRTFLERHGGRPKEIRLATWPEHFDRENSIIAYRNICREVYGGGYDAIDVFLICGYGGKRWMHSTQMACDPKAGGYIVFNE